MHIVMVRKWIGILNLLGLACGVIGGVLLAYSLELKPSNFRLVEGNDKQVAICLNGKKVVAGFGGPLVVSEEPCLDMTGTGPTPQVMANRPAFVTTGCGSSTSDLSFRCLRLSPLSSPNESEVEL